MANYCLHLKILRKLLFLVSILTTAFAHAASLDNVDLSRAKRVAVYMGTFDPPHNGHARVARGVLKEVDVDYVLVLPLPQPMHKRGVSPFLDRLRMTQIAFANDERLLVPEDNRSARQIISELKAINPQVEVLGIVGSDYIGEKIRWWLNRIYQRFSGIDITAVVLRDSADAPELERFRSANVETYRLMAESPESSSQVRKGNLGLVEPKVAEYIQSNNLYGLRTPLNCSMIFELPRRVSFH